MAATTMPKPHLLAIPFPLPGHILPMLKLCTEIAERGLSITFINTERNHSVVSLDVQSWRAGVDIQFQSVPDGLPHDFKLVDLDSLRLLLHAFENLKATFQSLMEKLIHETSHGFSCIVSDVYLGWTQDLAQQLGLPRIAFWTSNVSELCTYLHVPELVATQQLQFQFDRQLDESSLPQDGNIQIPGLPPLRTRDLPYLLRVAKDSSDILFRYFVDQASRITEAQYVLVNSFYDLEAEALDALKESNISNVLPIGPLISFPGLCSRADASQETQRCMQWLDEQDTGSVVYVAFGSSACISKAQVMEFAQGLELCGHAFCWVVPPGLAKGVEGTPLPETYLERVKTHSVVAKWVPQARVLAHRAVGCFVSHCGWNSTLESICAGVPMVCWPISADQPLTCKLVEDSWRIGKRVGREAGSGITSAGEVQEVVKMVMRDESLRGRSKELQRAAQKAALHSLPSTLDWFLHTFSN